MSPKHLKHQGSMEGSHLGLGPVLWFKALNLTSRRTRNWATVSAEFLSHPGKVMFKKTVT